METNQAPEVIEPSEALFWGEGRPNPTGTHMVRPIHESVRNARTLAAVVSERLGPSCVGGGNKLESAGRKLDERTDRGGAKAHFAPAPLSPV